MEDINEIRTKAKEILNNITQEDVDDWLSKYKPHVATKEEIEENRRKAYKYLF